MRGSSDIQIQINPHLKKKNVRVGGGAKGARRQKIPKSKQFPHEYAVKEVPGAKNERKKKKEMRKSKKENKTRRRKLLLKAILAQREE